ncbi:MAG: hypothetical protein Q9182_004592 [Xanthomendoza sp. 2 TL-2023]
MTPQDTKTVKTRFCIISDTHTAELWPHSDTNHAYRDPLPSADVLLHAGDITYVGYIHEYETMIELLSQADAELKIVIAGNHDISLDEQYYESTGKKRFHRNIGEDLSVIKELWTGEKARKAGIVYLEEGIRTFTLTNGARFTQLEIPIDVFQIYTSPYQPEFCDWAFPYYRNEDRFNPLRGAKNPIPDWPNVDIMLTHGPPAGVLDETNHGDKVGCEHLMRAVRRSRPRLHCFGHIHEAWGAQRTNWAQNRSNLLTVHGSQMVNDRCAYVDLTKDGDEPLAGFGEETLFVNAAIMNVNYQPVNAPWRVDLDLPMAEQEQALLMENVFVLPDDESSSNDPVTPTDDHPYHAAIPNMYIHPEWAEAIRQAWAFHGYSSANAEKFMAKYLKRRKKLFNVQALHAHQRRCMTDTTVWQLMLQQEERKLMETSPYDREPHLAILARMRKNKNDYLALKTQMTQTSDDGHRYREEYEELKARIREIFNQHSKGVRVSLEEDIQSCSPP